MTARKINLCKLIRSKWKMIFCKTKSTDQQPQNSSTSGGINDTPITNSNDDKIGFSEMANHLAASFFENDLSRGFVIGVEGAWGSGKSSLVNLALNKLKPAQQATRKSKETLETSEQKSAVVEFSPWLVGSRDELLEQFFLALGNASHEFLPEDTQESTLDLMKTYSVIASSVALPAELALNMIYPPSGTLIRWGIKKTSQLASKRSDSSLIELKLKLNKRLKGLKKPVIVFIDDLDRLEPREIIEVLRLIRAVADFPNVGYILAYDPEILALSVKNLLYLDDGHAFLEKIVQASFRVPDAQSFDLRNWLSAEFATLLGDEELDRDKQNRVLSVLDDWAGRYLVTPRDVVRTVNLLRLNFLPVRKYVDPGDALFLQLVRLKNDRLFQWIQRYVAALSIFADGGKISEGSRIRLGHDLLEIFGEKYGEDRAEFLYHLQNHLPGITSSETSKDFEFAAFSNLKVDDLQNYSRDRRLASPSHFSLYFSFTHTTGHLSDEEIEQFLELAVTDSDAATMKFAKWAAQSRPQGRIMGEVVLDRLARLAPRITHQQIEGIFEVLGRTMDELARNSNPSSGYPDFLLGAQSQVFGLIKALPNERRIWTLRRLFKTAPSLAWLAGIIQFNAQSEKVGWASADENAILTEDEFSVLSHEFADRLAAEETNKLLETPYFIFLLCAWYLVGDKARCRNWVKYVASTDCGFLNVIEKMIREINSSRSGVLHRIRPSDLVLFFGSFEAPINRLKAIARDAEDDTLRQRANKVLEIIDDPQ